jgi:hypothetical protein
VELRGRKCHISRSKSVFKKEGREKKKEKEDQPHCTSQAAANSDSNHSNDYFPNRIPNACSMSTLSERGMIPKWRLSI